MRVSKADFNLTPETFQSFRESMRNALVYFTGSPVKKEAKLFESCAIALGLKNSDILSATLMLAKYSVTDALDLYNKGVCPFTYSVLPESGQHACGSSVRVEDGQLMVDAFPRGMPVDEQLTWASKQPDDKVRILGNTPSNFTGVEPEGPDPHWHASVAGYRDALSNWFRSTPECSSVTVGYWHTNSEDLKSESFEDRLALETHYELVLNSDESLYQQTLSLYRMFKIGSQWHVSKDKDVVLDVVDPNDYYGAPGTTLLVEKIIDTLMNKSVKQPSRLLKMTNGKVNRHAHYEQAKNALRNIFQSPAIVAGFKTNRSDGMDAVMHDLMDLSSRMLESFFMDDDMVVHSDSMLRVPHPAK